MNYDLILKNNIKTVRTSKKISQEQLAHIVGVSRQTICYIENGQFNPSAKLALLICKALDYKFEDLFFIWGAIWKKLI